IKFDGANVIQGIHYDKENDSLLVADIADTLHTCNISEGSKSIKKTDIPARFLTYSKKQNLIMACSGWGELRGLRMVGGDIDEVFRTHFPRVCQMDCDSESGFLGMVTRDGGVLVFDLHAHEKIFERKTNAVPGICICMAHPNMV